MIPQQLNLKIQELIIEHVGGEKFFDALDDHIRSDKSYVATLLQMAEHQYGSTFTAISSGKFGQFFSQYKSTILVNGSLRTGLPITSLTPFTGLTNFIFFDDSFYSGKTRDAVRTEIQRIGGILLHTYVVYDGSPNTDPTVSSLYRYYP